LIAIQGSTTSHSDLQRAVDQITQETGYIDLLINNAGQTTFDSSPNVRRCAASIGRASVSLADNVFMRDNHAPSAPDVL
jgi:NAD(P)-dependent dehydrogenase (short-subunit alcohol dehydrogenase family)